MKAKPYDGAFLTVIAFDTGPEVDSTRIGFITLLRVKISITPKLIVHNHGKLGIYTPEKTYWKMSEEENRDEKKNILDQKPSHKT